MSFSVVMCACVQTEKEKADDLAQQMAKQAEQLVAERAEMAARNAALARENAQLMARLEFLEEAAAAAAAPDGCGDGASAEELGFLHQALQRCALCRQYPCPSFLPLSCTKLPTNAK